MSDLDALLTQMASRRKEQLEEALAIRREVVRRSLDEPDPVLTDEIVERATREADECLWQLELLDAVDSIMKPPVNVDGLPPTRWQRFKHFFGW